MRSIALFLELLVLLPVVLVRPFVGVILWSWISFMNPHRLVFGGVALAMPWAMLIFVATIIGCVMAREPRRLPVNAVTVQIGLFLILISITSLFALAPVGSTSRRNGKPCSRCSCSCSSPPRLLTSRERIHALVWVMALVAGLFRDQGWRIHADRAAAPSRVYGPESSMIRDNNHLAAAMLVGMPMMNYLRLEFRHAIIRYGFLAAMVLTLFAVVGSYSRGAFWRWLQWRLLLAQEFQ